MRDKISISKKITIASLVFILICKTAFSQDSSYSKTKLTIDSINNSDNYYFIPNPETKSNVKANSKNSTKSVYNIYRNGIVNRPTHYTNWWYRGLIW